MTGHPESAQVQNILHAYDKVYESAEWIHCTLSDQDRHPGQAGRSEDRGGLCEGSILYILYRVGKSCYIIERSNTTPKLQN